MNCALRKWRLSDAKDLATALNNEKILNNLRDGLPFPYTEKDAAEYISAMLSADENSTFAYAVTVDDRAVGSIGAFRQSNIHCKTAELGYYLAEEYWGRGLMTEAAKQVIVYGFEYIGLDVMMIRTGEENLASQRIIEKCGFQYEGTLRRIYRIYDGTVKPVRCYTMLREEYDGLRQAGVL